MKAINYEQARNLIADGDVVFVKNGKTIWSKLTQEVTDSNIYHCGLAFWVRDPRYKSRLFIVEAAKGGRRIVSLSNYSSHELDVIKLPVDWEMHCDPVLENTGAIPYSYIEYIWIGLLELFRIRRKEDDLGEVCSKMVAKYCKEGGMTLETDISPAKLKSVLMQLGCELKCTVAPTASPT